MLARLAKLSRQSNAMPCVTGVFAVVPGDLLDILLWDGHGGAHLEMAFVRRAFHWLGQSQHVSGICLRLSLNGFAEAWRGKLERCCEKAALSRTKHYFWAERAVAE